jgi:cell wall-associated NlpC family hydrolase
MRTIAAFLVVPAAACVLAGCGTSAPRFRPDSDAPAQDVDEVRYAATITEEEAREDDRKVDVHHVKKLVPPVPGTTSEDRRSAPPGLNRDRVLIDALSFLGVPYRYGGSTKDGVDCSGFTSRVYESAIGLELPHSTRGQFMMGAVIDRDELEFGDLVFFNTTGRRPSHVGMYIEGDLFVHVSVVTGVTISSLESTYYRKRFVGARRIVDDR